MYGSRGRHCGTTVVVGTQVCSRHHWPCTVLLQDLSKLAGRELEAAERGIKQRTLGNLRLIGELFNKEVVREPILHVCMGELLGETSEDNVEVGASSDGTSDFWQHL